MTRRMEIILGEIEVLLGMYPRETMSTKSGWSITGTDPEFLNYSTWFFLVMAGNAQKWSPYTTYLGPILIGVYSIILTQELYHSNLSAESCVPHYCSPCTQHAQTTLE